MFKEQIAELGNLAIEKLGVVLTEEQLEKFVLFGNLLLKWNAKVNLTRITEPGEVIIKHFLDSLVVVPFLYGVRVCDVGTGAGFPGIPLLIAKPELEATLVDSLAKRIEFVKTVAQELNLSLEAIHSRAEDFARLQQFRESYDSVVSRAVAALPILAEYALPLLKNGGVFFAFKGSQAGEEVRAAAKALDVLGGKVEEIREFNLGASAEHRSLLVIRKYRETPPVYPRKAGVPERRPLV